MKYMNRMKKYEYLEKKLEDFGYEKYWMVNEIH
jgi:hypothetical protein